MNRIKNFVGKYRLREYEKTKYLEIIDDLLDVDVSEYLTKLPPFFTWWLTKYYNSIPEKFYRVEAKDRVLEKLNSDPVSLYIKKDGFKYLLDEALEGIYYLDVLNSQVKDAGEYDLEIRSKYIKYINWYIVLYEYVLPRVMLPVLAKEKIEAGRDFKNLKRVNSKVLYDHISSDKYNYGSLWEKQDINFRTYFNMMHNFRNAIAHGNALLEGDDIVLEFNIDSVNKQRVRITTTEFERFFLRMLDIVNGFAMGFKMYYIKYLDSSKKISKYPFAIRRELYRYEESHFGLTIDYIDIKAKEQLNIHLKGRKLEHTAKFVELMRLSFQAKKIFPEFNKFFIGFRGTAKYDEFFIVPKYAISKYEKKKIDDFEFLNIVLKESLVWTKHTKSKVKYWLRRKIHMVKNIIWFFNDGIDMLRTYVEYTKEKLKVYRIVDLEVGRKVDDIRKVKVTMYIKIKDNYIHTLRYIYKISRKISRKYSPSHIFIDVFNRRLRRSDYKTTDDNIHFICRAQWLTNKKCSKGFYYLMARKPDIEYERILFWLNRKVVTLVINDLEIKSEEDYEKISSYMPFMLSKDLKLILKNSD